MTRPSSAFDDLLAAGRQELDELAGRPAEAPPQDPPAPANPPEGIYQGTAGGTPFRLKVK